MMMKKAILFLAIFFSGLFLHSQSYVLVSRFDWDSNPVTTAIVGPNATSVSTSAGSTAGGAGGTNGLNPRIPGSTTTQDINLTIPGSPTFDLNGIDIWMDFQREETEASFYRRSGFNFGMLGSSITASFRVSDGAGSYITVNSGSVYSVPNDDIFRTYRFFYNPVNGMAGIHVNGVQVWSYDGPDNRNLYWVSAGNVVVGAAADGTGNNKPIMDNLRVYSVINSPLPVELLNFNAYGKTTAVDIRWETASESQNDFFTVERSADGFVFEKVDNLAGKGTTNAFSTYAITDNFPFSGISYYRLKQTDFNGDEHFSHTVAVNLQQADQNDLSVFPNPGNGSSVQVQLPWTGAGLVAEVYDLSNRLVTSQYIDNNISKSCTLQWASALPKGIYMLVMRNGTKNASAKMVVQ